jgi:hypothetical protein
MVLAQLCSSADMLSRRCITLRTQGLRQQLRPRDWIGCGDHGGPMLADQVGHPALGERTDGLLAVAFGQKSQRGDR